MRAVEQFSATCIMTALLVSSTLLRAEGTKDQPLWADLAAISPQADGNLVLQAVHAVEIGANSDADKKIGSPRRFPVKDRYGFESTQVARLQTASPARLAWKIESAAAAEYDVLADYSGGREAYAEVKVGDVKLRKERFGAGWRIQHLGRLTLPAGELQLSFAFDRMPSSTETRNMDIQLRAVLLFPVANEMAAKTQRELQDYLLPIIERQPVPGLMLPGIFSDHMVLQRDLPVPVWGLAKPGETVTVTFAGQSKTAIPDIFGRWMLHLDPMPASAEPRTMTIASAPPRPSHPSPDPLTSPLPPPPLTFADILVGDVWLGSGQSNMEIGVDAPKDWPRHVGAEALIGERDFPLIRISSHCPRYFKTPNGGWVPATHENIFQTSAMMVCTMVPLQERLNVPIGIIVRALSSSPSGAWVSPDAIAASAEIQQQIADYAAVAYDQAWAAAVEKTAAQDTIPTIPYSAPPWPGMSCWRRDGIGGLWQGLVEPIVPYAIKGVLWDQGESRTDIGGTTHDTVQPVLIRSWRAAWQRAGGQDDFPFVHIQKKEYDAKTLAAIAAVPNTFMVSNHGLDQRLHPVDKDKYGERAEAVILENCYNQ